MGWVVIIFRFPDARWFLDKLVEKTLKNNMLKSCLFCQLLDGYLLFKQYKFPKIFCLKFTENEKKDRFLRSSSEHY